MAKKFNAYEYFEQMYAPDLGFDSAEAYINPDDSEKEKKRKYDVAKLSVKEQASKLENLYRAYNQSTDNVVSVGPKTYIEFDNDGNFVVKDKKEPNKYNKEFSNALSEKTVNPLDTMLSDSENQTYDMMDMALQSRDLASKEEAMSKLQKELEYKSEMLKQDKKPNGEKLTDEEKELLNTDIDVLSEALKHPETIISPYSKDFTKRLTGENEYVENKELVSKVNTNLEPKEQDEIVNYDKKMRDFKGNISLKKPAVYKFRYKNKDGKWVYKLGYETLGGIYNRYKDSKQKGELQILSYYQGGDAQTMEQRYHYLLKKAKVPFAVDKDFGSGYSETYGIDPSLRIHSDEFNRINSGLKSIGQLKLAFDKANVDANVKKEIGILGTSKGLAKRGASGVTTAIAGVAAGFMDLVYPGDPNKAHQDTNSVWGQASNYLHKVANESNYIYGIDESAEKESYKTFENGIIEWKRGNWGRAFWNWAKSAEQGGLQVTANSLGLVGGIALTAYVPGGLFARGLSMSKNAAQLSSQITMYGLMEANANIYERYKNNNYKELSNNEKTGIYLGSIANAALQMGVFHHIVKRNGPVLKSISGEEIALNELNKVAQERIKFSVGRNLIKRTIPSMAEEAGAEYVETLYDEVTQKLGTEKYIGKNLENIIDDVQHEALYSALMGAASGGIMVSPRTVGEFIGTFNEGVYAKLNPEEFISERVHDILEGMDEQTKSMFDERLKTGIKVQEAGIKDINELLQKSPEEVIEILGETIVDSKAPEKQELIDVYNQIVAKNLLTRVHKELTTKHFEPLLKEPNIAKKVMSHAQNFFNTFSSEADRNVLLAKVKKVLGENEDIVLGINNDEFSEDPVGTLNAKIEEALENADVGTLKQFFELTRKLSEEFTESEFKDKRTDIRTMNINLIKEFANSGNPTLTNALNNTIKQELAIHKSKTENGIKIQNKILELSSQYKGQETKNIDINDYVGISKEDERKLTDADLFNLQNQAQQLLNSENEKTKARAEKILKKINKQIEYRQIGKQVIGQGLSQVGTVGELATNEVKKEKYKQWQKIRYESYKDRYYFTTKTIGKNMNEEIQNIVDITFSNEDEDSKAEKLKQKIDEFQKIYNEKSKDLNEEDKKKLEFTLLHEPKAYASYNLFKDILSDPELSKIKDEEVKKQYINKEIVDKIDEKNFDFYKEVLTDFALNKDELSSTIEENDFQSIFKFIKENSEAFEALLKANTYEKFKKDYVEVNKEALETGFDTKKGEHRAGIKEYNDFTDNIENKSIDEIEKNNENLLKFTASRSINKIRDWGNILKNKKPISADAIKTIFDENKKIITASILRTNKISETIKNIDNEEEKQRLKEQLDSIKIARYLLPYINANGEIVVMDRGGNEKSIGKNIKSIRNSSIGLIKAYRDTLSQSPQELKDALSETGYDDIEIYNRIVNAFGKNKSKSSEPNNDKQSHKQSQKQQGNSQQTNQQKKSTIKLVEDSPAYKKNKQEIDNLLSQVVPKLGFIKPNSTYTIDKNIGVYVSKKSSDNEYKVAIIKKDGEHTFKTLVLKVRDDGHKQYKNFIAIENYDVFDLNELSSEMLKNNADFKTDELLNNFIKKLAFTTNRLFKNDKSTNTKGIIKPDGKGGTTAAHLPFLHISAQKTDESGNKIESSGTYAFIFKLAQDSKTGTSTFVRVNYDIDGGKFFVKSSRKIVVNENEDNTEYAKDLLDSSMMHLFGSKENIKLVLSKMQTLGSKYDFSFPAEIDFVSTLQNNDLTKLLLNKVSNIGKTTTTPAKPTPEPKGDNKPQAPVKKQKVENVDEIERNLNKVKGAFSGGITSTNDLLENIENQIIEEIDSNIETSKRDDYVVVGNDKLKLTKKLKQLYKEIKEKQNKYESNIKEFGTYDISEPNEKTFREIKKEYMKWLKSQKEFSDKTFNISTYAHDIKQLVNDFYTFSLLNKDSIKYIQNLFKDNTIKSLSDSEKTRLQKEYPELFYVNNQIMEFTNKGAKNLDSIENMLKKPYNTLNSLLKKIEENC